MRDLILLAALSCLFLMTARAPFIGVLVWLWVTLMNPQREVYTVLHNFELNLYVALFTAAAWLFSRERKAPPADGFILFLLLFALWSTVCTYAALDRAFSLPLWERTMKTVILVLAVAALARSQTRIQAVVWMLVASIGYYAVKGGGFVLLTGAQHHVYGPDNTMIADNNALGLALVVLLPLMAYLQATTQLAAARLATIGAILLDLLAIVGTYSRGALLALVALVAVQATRSRKGLAVLAAGGVLAAALPTLAPAGWLERMSTIKTADEDASFQGRMAAWRTSVNIALARPLVGGGFSAVEVPAVSQRFKSEGSLDGGKAAHSIYFEVLGDTGFVGLVLYLAMLGAAALNTVSVLAETRQRPDLAWARLLARALQFAMAALLVGGAGLSMAYYDGFLVTLALTSCLRSAVRERRAAAPAASPPRRAQQMPLAPAAGVFTREHLSKLSFEGVDWEGRP